MLPVRRWLSVVISFRVRSLVLFDWSPSIVHWSEWLFLSWNFFDDLAKWALIVPLFGEINNTQILHIRLCWRSLVWFQPAFSAFLPIQYVDFTLWAVSERTFSTSKATWRDKTRQSLRVPTFYADFKHRVLQADLKGNDNDKLVFSLSFYHLIRPIISD